MEARRSHRRTHGAQAPWQLHANTTAFDVLTSMSTGDARSQLLALAQCGSRSCANLFAHPSDVAGQSAHPRLPCGCGATVRAAVQSWRDVRRRLKSDRAPPLASVVPALGRARNLVLLRRTTRQVRPSACARLHITQLQRLTSLSCRGSRYPGTQAMACLTRVDWGRCRGSRSCIWRTAASACGRLH